MRFGSHPSDVIPKNTISHYNIVHTTPTCVEEATHCGPLHTSVLAAPWAPSCWSPGPARADNSCTPLAAAWEGPPRPSTPSPPGGAVVGEEAAPWRQSGVGRVLPCPPSSQGRKNRKGILDRRGKGREAGADGGRCSFSGEKSRGRMLTSLPDSLR